MKHCPNPECLHRAMTGGVAEFQDSVDDCPDCGAALLDGGAPATDSDEGTGSEHDDLLRYWLPEGDQVEWITLARFPSPAVAHAARVALASFKIPSLVHMGCNPWAAVDRFVHLQVPACVAARAWEFLERREPVESAEEPTYEQVRKELDRERDRIRIGRALFCLAFLGWYYLFLGTVFGGGMIAYGNVIESEFQSYRPGEIVAVDELGIEYTAEDLLAEASGLSRVLFLEFYVIGFLFLFLRYWAGRSPVPPLIIGLCLFLVLMAFEVIVDIGSIREGIVIKVAIALVLQTGIRTGLARRAG